MSARRWLGRVTTLARVLPHEFAHAPVRLACVVADGRQTALCCLPISRHRPSTTQWEENEPAIPKIVRPTCTVDSRDVPPAVRVDESRGVLLDKMNKVSHVLRHPIAIVGDDATLVTKIRFCTRGFEAELRYSDQSEDAAIRTGLDGWRTKRRTTV